MALEKKDFIEVEFTAKVKDGEIFDSNIKEDLEKVHEGHNHEIKAEPFVFCLGEGMFLEGVDDFLIGKPEDPATYEIELPPEKAFGKRNPALMQKIPIKVFKEQNLNPIPGFVFNFDGRIGKVLASSGGRVIVDFNNPVAGKDVVYKVHIFRKITSEDEKVKALVKFFFRDDFKFEIKEKKILLHVPLPLVEFAKIFSEKFKSILGLELEALESKEKRGEKAEAKA